MFSTILFGQNLSFQKFVYTWPTEKPNITKQTNSFSNEDLVIIDEYVKLDLTNDSWNGLKKKCVVKINNEAGVKKLSPIVLPESFDESGDRFMPHRSFSMKSNPFIYEFKITYFAARILKRSGTVENCNPDITTKKIYWVADNGRHLEDFNYLFRLNNIEVGDIIEYTYSIEYKKEYASNIFYFHSTIPKQNTEFEINYLPIRDLESYKVICNMNIPDSCLYQKNIHVEKGIKKNTGIYRFKNLKALNYSLNSCIGKSLPHLSIDYTNYNRGPNFEWIFWNNYVKDDAIYNNRFANIRKFISKLPSPEPSDNSDFLYALNKSLNELKFISAESLNYGENPQYAVNSGEWLNKGKLVEEFMMDMYAQLLDEAYIPFKFVCVHDKRFGELKNNCRAESKYEKFLFAIPKGKSLLYMPDRANGLKYHLNELPFYYEGTIAAIVTSKEETRSIKQNDSLKDYKFIRTQSGTENENLRIENAVLKVNLDSSCINASIKENLVGQFSTIIRPFYLNDPIDSTVSSIYFKKCIAKPNATNASITLSSKSEYAPFKYTFNCSEKIPVVNKTEISLKDWFSFIYSKKLIPEKPNFDYYVDFRYTDMYNFMFEFNKATEILNGNDFIRAINNTYFELSSKLVKQTEASYLLSVIVKVKQPVIPVNETNTLMELCDNLEQLNNLILKFK